MFEKSASSLVSRRSGWRWVSKSPDPSDAFCDAMCARAGRLAASLASTREYHQSSRILRWSSSTPALRARRWVSPRRGGGSGSGGGCGFGLHTPVRSLCASSSLRDIIANPLLRSRGESRAHWGSSGEGGGREAARLGLGNRQGLGRGRARPGRARCGERLPSVGYLPHLLRPELAGARRPSKCNARCTCARVYGEESGGRAKHGVEWEACDAEVLTSSRLESGSRALAGAPAPGVLARKDAVRATGPVKVSAGAHVNHAPLERQQ